MPRKPQFGSIYQPTKSAGVKTSVWWIRYYVNGIQQSESSKSKRYTDAEKLLKERSAEIQTGQYAGPVAEKIKVSYLLDDLIQDFETNGKAVAWVRHVDKHLRPSLVSYALRGSPRITSGDTSTSAEERKSQTVRSTEN
jgi:hypothetical protein